MHDKKDIVYYVYIDFDKCKTNKDIKAEKNKIEGMMGTVPIDKNIRGRFIQALKKYVCIDTDDKKSNDFIVTIMNKYNIKGNSYPSISNYFKPDLEENSHKYHYWFETDLPITSHVRINNTHLDVWGPKCYYTTISETFKNHNNNTLGKNDEDYRIIYEPNVPGMYLDTFKKYPILTDEIYHDIMNINLNTGFFSKKEKIPSCLFHDDCIAFELFKSAEEIEFKRDGYPQMSGYHKKIFNDYRSNHKVNTAPLIIDDVSRGVICCCINDNDSKDPFIVALRMQKEGRVANGWGLPKGHPTENESEINNAVREMREEVGVDVCKYIHEDVYVSENYTFFGPLNLDRWKMHHDYPCESKRPNCIYYKEVKYFLAILPEKIELKPQPEEVLECKWVRLSELKKMTYPNVSKMLSNFIDSKKVKSKLECKKKVSELLMHTKKEESNHPGNIEKQKSKYAFNILDPFHLFDKNKKMKESDPSQKNQQCETINKKKGLFDLFKKK